jgi:hypothetical protein
VVGLALVALLGLPGCAALGLTLLSAGVGTAAGTGVGYTLDSIAYKTFTTSVDTLEVATIKALERMDMPITTRESMDNGLKIVALAGDREIDIELDRLTTRTARMRVDARINWLLKDRATAAEIIVQTAQALEDEERRALARGPRPDAKPKNQTARPGRAWEARPAVQQAAARLVAAQPVTVQSVTAESP